MKRAGILSVLMATCSLALAAAGSQAPSSAAEAKVVGVQKLKENLYLLSGGGATSLVFITDLGVVLIDTKPAGWGQPILDKIKTITTKPVTTIINTHAHADNVGSNEFFPTSVEIISQENTRLAMDKMGAFRGAKVNYLPKLMFKEKMTIGSGKDRIDLYYYGRGHTGGDAWVVFPALRVVHAGGLLRSKQLPIIDLDNGGSGLTYGETLAKAIVALKNIDIVVPSDGPLMTMKDVEEYAQLNREFRDAAVSGFNHGLSVTEVAEAWKLPEKYRTFAAPPELVKSNVRAVFSELTHP